MSAWDVGTWKPLHSAGIILRDTALEVAVPGCLATSWYWHAALRMRGVESTNKPRKESPRAQPKSRIRSIIV